MGGAAGGVNDRGSRTGDARPGFPLFRVLPGLAARASCFSLYSTVTLFARFRG
jgi:hypothetical protein